MDYLKWTNENAKMGQMIDARAMFEKLTGSLDNLILFHEFDAETKGIIEVIREHIRTLNAKSLGKKNFLM